VVCTFVAFRLLVDRFLGTCFLSSQLDTCFLLSELEDEEESSWRKVRFAACEEINEERMIMVLPFIGGPLLNGLLMGINLARISKKL
jgi:hypothetical protein